MRETFTFCWASDPTHAVAVNCGIEDIRSAFGDAAAEAVLALAAKEEAGEAVDWSAVNVGD